MNLGNIQATIATALSSSPDFIAAGLTVYDPQSQTPGLGIVVDDGLPGTWSAIESSLRDIGLCVTVGTPQGGTLVDSVAGCSAMRIQIPVSIQENVEKNRGDTGTGLTIFESCDAVVLALTRQATGLSVQSAMKPTQIRVGGFKEGLWDCVAVFSVTLFWP